MENQTLRKFKWFWAWDDEKEEAWLTEMSKQGWHLSSANFGGSYYFRKGPEEEYAYRLDFQTDQTKSRQEYLQLFADAGWEHVSTMGGWQYFRKLYRTGESDEIYTDNHSKVAKYQRVMMLLVIFLPVYMIMLRSELSTRYGGIFIFIEVLQFLLLVVYIFAIVKLIQRITQLKKG